MTVAATDPSIVLVKHRPVRAVMATVSSLSILGSLLIILSYVFFKDLRTRARYILLHLSIADLGVGLANLTGIAVNFDGYFMAAHKNGSEPTNLIQDLCVTQGFFAIYFTLSSILWTSCLAVYMYLLIVHNQNTRQLRYFLWFSHFACYGLPLVVNFWLVFTQRLGYAPYDSAGWCSMIGRHTSFQAKHEPDRYATFFGYDLWVLLTFALTVLLYCTVVCHVRQEHQKASNTKGFWEAMHRIDYKFILIPVFFLVLRIWSFVVDLLMVYIHIRNLNLVVLNFLIYTSGIGDSAQGFVNSILFVALTYKVRRTLFPWCYRRQPASPVIYSESRSLIHQPTQNGASKHTPPRHYSSTSTNSLAFKSAAETDGRGRGYTPETPPRTPPPHRYTPVSGPSH